MQRFILFLFLTFLMSTLYAIDPPMKLKWEMSYEDVKNHLEEKDIDIDDLEEDDGLLAGFNKAELDDIEVKDEDAWKPYAVFDDNDKLAAVVYNFRWLLKPGNLSVTWKFYQDLSEIFTKKYGEPSKNDTKNKRGQHIEKDLVWQTKWYDKESNEEVVLEITGHSILWEDWYFVKVYYLSDTFRRAQEESVSESDDL